MNAQDKAKLHVRQLSKQYGRFEANRDIDLDVVQGELHAVIGPNGAGKTTLIAQLGGEILSSSGAISLNGQDITKWPSFQRARHGLARTFQISRVFQNFSALENVAMAAQAHEGHSFRFWRRAKDDAVLNAKAAQALEHVGLSQRHAVQASDLSHGEQRSLELAMALVTCPRILLLDEPAAGLGPEESNHLVKLLEELKKSYGILLIEHDMDLVFRVADRVTVLVNGRILASGLPEDIRADQDVQRAYLGAEHAVQGEAC